MQLLKKREFGDYFNDTFAFLRENGKHYFKTYFLVNGAPLVLFILFIYFMTTSLYGLSTFGGDTSAIFEDYFNKNAGLLILSTVAFVLLIVIFMILQYAYTPVYLILYQEKGTDFTAKDMFRVILKEKIGKILIFFLVGLLLLIPVGIVTSLAALIFAITIVGVFIPLAAVSLWFSMAFIAYLSTDKGVFESLGYAWDMLFYKFWQNVGAVAVFMLLVMVVNFGVSIVITTITSLISFNTIEAADQDIIAVISAVFSLVITQGISLFLQSVNQLVQNIVYFSIKESRENIASKYEIDQIGSGE